MDANFWSSFARERTGDLAICEVCGKPKEKAVTRGGVEIVVPVNCDCEKAMWALREKRQAEAAFKMRIRNTWDADGICITGFQQQTFQTDMGGDTDAMAMCQRYAEKFEEMKSLKCGMLIYGPLGVGKSCAAHAIANALLSHMVPVCVTTMPRLLEQMGNRVDVIRAMQHYDLLVIDDFGTERETSYGAELAYSIIDARYSSGLPVVITTNLTHNEITTSGSRVFDRIIEMCPIVIKMTGESKRSEIAKKAAQRAKEILMKKENEDVE